MSQFKPPYLGAAYYPEDWPLEQIDDDIKLMKLAGINAARIGKFVGSAFWDGLVSFNQRAAILEYGDSDLLERINICE